jgi:hypothetical protein
MDRSQLSEAEYLAMHGAVAGGAPPAAPPPARPRLAAASGCAQCERLLRAREGAAAQLAHLSASLELAEGEAESARALALRLWTAASAAGVALDAEALGAGALLDRAGWGAAASARRGAAAAAAAAPAAPQCEGDGAHPARPVALLQPHGPAVNVLAVAPLAGGAGAAGAPPLPLLLATSGGDKSVQLCLAAEGGGGSFTVLARLLLPAPALKLLARPGGGGGGGGELLATCLDGGVHLLSWRAGAACAGLGGGAALALRWSAPRAHGKFAAAAAWGECGGIFATGGGEGGVALFEAPARACERCAGGGDAPFCAACAPRKLQQLVFPRGAVTALAFALEEAGGGGGARVDALAVAVAGAHCLAYARLLRAGEGAGGAAGVEAAAAQCERAGGAPLPLLTAAGAAAAARLFLFYAPLSEEAAPVDFAWGAPGSGGAAAAAAAAALDGGAAAAGGGGGGGGGEPAAGLHPAFRHTLVDLAVGRFPGGGAPLAPPLLAAATCSGGVFLLRWATGGAGATLARACGRVDAGGVRGEASELAPPARVCWLPPRGCGGGGGGGPFYFAVANGGGEDASISVVSAGTGRVVAALKGHTGVVKGLAAWAPGAGAPPRLLSCGFDKNVIAWGE